MDDSEYIDISKETRSVGKVLLEAFRRSGFARAYSSNNNHLLPCPLGTFVNKSVRDSADLRCQECPAGKLLLKLNVDVTSNVTI